MSDFDQADPLEQKIDKALAKLLKNTNDFPPDVAVKVINSAISFYKAKNSLKDKDESFNAEDI
jgi:hypothetical protein